MKKSHVVLVLALIFGGLISCESGFLQPENVIDGKRVEMDGGGGGGGNIRHDPIAWTRYHWTMPTTGTRVVHYVGQQSTDGYTWSDQRNIGQDTFAVWGLDYDVVNYVRVAGVDSNRIQGPFSEPSDPYVPRGDNYETIPPIVEYRFEAGAGNIVYDTGSYGDQMNLTIQDVQNVTWGTGELTINEPTILLAENSDKLDTFLKASNEITISIVMATSDQNQYGPARIVSYSSDPYSRNFTAGQDYENLDVRLNTTETSGNGMPGTFAPGMNHSFVWFVYTRNAAGDAKIYVNGYLITENTVGGNFSSWHTNCSFAIGNEITQDRAWTGTLKEIDIYDYYVPQEDIPLILGIPFHRQWRDIQMKEELRK